MSLQKIEIKEKVYSCYHNVTSSDSSDDPEVTDEKPPLKQILKQLPSPPRADKTCKKWVKSYPQNKTPDQHYNELSSSSSEEILDSVSQFNRSTKRSKKRRARNSSNSSSSPAEEEKSATVPERQKRSRNPQERSKILSLRNSSAGGSKPPN